MTVEGKKIMTGVHIKVEAAIVLEIKQFSGFFTKL